MENPAWAPQSLCCRASSLPKGQSTHTGIEVKMQLRLTGIQRRKLLGIPEEKLDLEACFVPTIGECQKVWGQCRIRADIWPHDPQTANRHRCGNRVPLPGS